MQQGMWKGRFHQDMNAKVLAYSQSLDLDWRLLPWDVAGSKAHAEMLANQGIIPQEDADAIIKGLDAVLAEIESGTFTFKEELEDIH